MRGRLFKESFWTTTFVMVSMYLLSFIEFNSDIVNPLSKALSDFELTDVVFSHMRENPGLEDRITMVNIGNLDRRGIADLIEQINQHHPKVIGIDAFFRHLKEDTEGDSLLAAALSKVNHMVMVSELHENAEKEIIDSVSLSHPLFMQHAEPGFADMISEGRDFFVTSRDCIPVDSVNGERVLSFPVKMAYLYDSVQTKRFLARGNATETINFQGNIDTRKEGVSANSKIVFAAVDWRQVFDTLYTPSVFENKIVIMGYMGDYIGHHTWEDKFFTPLNSNYVGKANPDMYGVVVHANIVSMILKGHYINDMSDWINLPISLVLIFLNVWLFSFLFIRLEMWYDGATFFLTIFEVMLLIIVVLFIFDRYNYRVDITLPSIALFLTGNLIEIYYGLIKPLYSKIVNKIVH